MRRLSRKPYRETINASSMSNKTHGTPLSQHPNNLACHSRLGNVQNGENPTSKSVSGAGLGGETCSGVVFRPAHRSGESYVPTEETKVLLVTGITVVFRGLMRVFEQQQGSKGCSSGALIPISPRQGSMRLEIPTSHNFGTSGH